MASTRLLTNPLCPRDPPVREEVVDNVGVLELDVVDVSVGLTVEGQCRGLALGADGGWPRGVGRTTTSDLQINIVQGCKLASL